MIKLIQADGLDQLKQNNSGQGDAGDVFPGATDNRTFNSISKPNSKSYSGADSYVSVTNIPPPSTTMTLNITVTEGDRPPSNFDSKMWYRLKNSYNHGTHCLDVINNNGTDSTGLLQMAADGNYSGQYWQLKLNDDKETYSLRTLFLGPNRQLSVQSDKKTPVLEPINADDKGQHWTIRSWDRPVDGTWFLWVSSHTND